MNTLKLQVEGMTCDGCKATVERVLRAVPGVDEVVVDLHAASATVRGASPDADAALRAVIRAGFDAAVVTD
jgi:copper chaperone CopZ